MGFKIFIVLLAAINSCFAQETKIDQSTSLKRYIGEWVSSASPDSNNAIENPQIKMVNRPKMGSGSIQVEVFQLRDGTYIPILVELISYDSKTDQIVALGQNEKGECFTGVGRFSDNNNWTMRDNDLNGKHTQTVTFKFSSDTEVYLEGSDSKGKILWRTRYLKV